MRKSFIGFIGYSEEDFQELWQKAIFVPDTNVLLNFYRYQAKETTTTFMEFLIELKEMNRLWIPHQVALEYFHNYKNVMNEDKEGYLFLRDGVQSISRDAKSKINKAKEQYGFLDFKPFDTLIEEIEEIIQPYLNSIEDKLGEKNESEEIEKELRELMMDIVGDPFDKNAMRVIHLKGEVRYDKKVPPGYMDKNKDSHENYRTYGDISYKKKYGDLILWEQMIKNSKEKEKPIIFITEDQKEDWWDIKKGKKKGPLPTLIQEFFDRTDQLIYIYSTEVFLNYASKYLELNISEDEYREIKQDVDEIRKRDSFLLSNESQKTDLKEYLSNVEINNILRYLSDKEKQELNRRIKNIFSNDEFESPNIVYKEILIETVAKFSHEIQQRTQNLIAELATLNYEDSIYFIEKIEQLPKNEVEKSLLLLNLNGEIEKRILQYELPF